MLRRRKRESEGKDNMKGEEAEGKETLRGEVHVVKGKMGGKEGKVRSWGRCG